MNRSTVILCAALVMLSLAYGVALSVAAAKKKETLLLHGADPGAAATLTVSAAGRSAALKKEQKEYILSSSFGNVPADPAAVTAFLAPWKTAAIDRDLGSYTTGELATFGITDKTPAFSLDIDGVQRSFLLGGNNPVADQAYIYDRNKGKLLLIDQRAAALLRAVTPEYFRKNRIIEASTASITALAWQASGGKPRRLYKEGDDWYIEEGDRCYLCETSSATYILTKLVNQRISDFTAAEDPKNVPGLRSCRDMLSVTVSFTTAPAAALTFRSAYAAGRHPVIMNGAAMGAADAAGLLEALRAPALSFARTRIINFPPALIVSFTVRSGDTDMRYRKERGTWYRIGKTKREMHEGTVNQFLAVTMALTLDRFPGADAQLGTAGKEYIYYDRNGRALVDITLGDEYRDGDKAYIQAKLAGKKTLIAISKELVEALPL